MGSLFINIGQCGNQIGLQLMDYLEQSNQQYEDSFIKRQEQNIMHSILIDTEPKILRSVVENKKRYPFIDNKNVIYCQHGRGNNWALGYMDLQLVQKRKKNLLQRQQDQQIFKTGKFNKDQSQLLSQIINTPYQQEVSHALQNDNYLKENTQIIEDTIQCIRKEIEKIDYFIGINMMSSLGGGTGSGLGSRLVQEFKDIFNDGMLVNTVVFPSKSGENTLQHYNSILSLSQLQAYSDCIIYFSNDKINNYLSYQKSKNLEKSVDITNINQYIASQLSNMVRINDMNTYNRFYFDLLMSTTPLDDYKFVELYSSPYLFDKVPSSNSQTSWEKMADIVCGQVNVDDSLDDKQKPQNKNVNNSNNNKFTSNFKKHSSLFVNSIFKSQDVQKSLEQQQSLRNNIQQKLSSTFNPVHWNPTANNLEFIEQNQQEVVDNKMMLTMANTTHIMGLVQDIADTAYNKFKANAFLHWYYKYDLDHSDFQHAFNTMDTIIENYNSIL